jgi:hypothetical protein
MLPPSQCLRSARGGHLSRYKHITNQQQGKPSTLAMRTVPLFRICKAAELKTPGDQVNGDTKGPTTVTSGLGITLRTAIACAPQPQMMT